MTQNARKQVKLDRFAALYLFIFLPCMWGLAFQNASPERACPDLCVSLSLSLSLYISQSLYLSLSVFIQSVVCVRQLLLSFAYVWGDERLKSLSIKTAMSHRCEQYEGVYAREDRSGDAKSACFRTCQSIVGVVY